MQKMVRSAECRVRLLDAENFFGSARALPSKKTVAIRYLPFANRHSLFAAILGSAGTSPSHSSSSPSLVPITVVLPPFLVLFRELLQRSFALPQLGRLL